MRVRSSTAETAAVDRLVLVTVNAPYKSDIGATALSECLAHADLGTWPVHVATFFTDVETDLVFRFAASHGIAKSALAKAYLVMRAATGERNPVLEAELVPLGAGRRQAVEPRLHLA
jgi:hypothetical protein